MAFVHQPLGAIVATDPQAAHAQLSELFATHGTREAVSKAIKVDARTLARWIAKLIATGHGDPRKKKDDAKPGKKGRRRKAAKKVVAP